MPRRPRHIVIVGGGFSGAAAALHLSRRAPEPIRISVIEPRPELGMGVAHGTTEIHNRLNGTDAIHSPYPEAPHDFAEWMQRSGELAADPAARVASGLIFPRRGAFGRYMAAEMARHAAHNPSGSRLEHVADVAVRLIRERDGVRVVLRGGGEIQADHAILALGWNAVATPRELAGLAGQPGWLANPWHTAGLDGLAPQAPVLLVGTGLTASDTYAALVARGHQGPVVALSRRGMRPASQNPHRSTRSIWDRVQDPDPAILRRMAKPATARAAMHQLRQQFRWAEAQGLTWHTPFDELRDAVGLFWPDWPLAEKRRYLRHAKPWYDTFRFRNPPQTEAIVDAGVTSGHLQFVAGRLREAQASAGELRVRYQPRQGGDARTLTVAAVVNCTGPSPRPSQSDNPFWRQVLADGVGRDCPSGLGVHVDAAGCLISATGVADPSIRVIGPPTLGQFGEATAVPYIVCQILPLLGAWFR